MSSLTHLLKTRPLHKITISSSTTHTFCDVDFIVYCQKALFSNDIWRIRIEDWEPGYCIAYLHTLRQFRRWKPLTLEYKERGNYIYVCRTLKKPARATKKSSHT